MSRTPKLTKPDRAAPAAKRVQNPCAHFSRAASVPVRPATARARQRELSQVCAAREDAAEDGEHQTLASSPGLTVIRTLGTLSPNKLPKGPKPPKPPHVRVESKTGKRSEGSKWHEPKGPVGGFASPNRQISYQIRNLEMLRILGVP